MRILIRKIQLVAAQYDKALLPIFSYSKEHYMRAFLRNDKGKNKVDEILRQHAYFNNAGPLWIGSLWDRELIERICNNAISNKIFNENKELIKFLEIIKNESKINAVGFYDLHDLYKRFGIKKLQKKEDIISKIKKIGCKASETHFKGEGIRSDISIVELVKVLRD